MVLFKKSSYWKIEPEYVTQLLQIYQEFPRRAPLKQKLSPLESEEK